MLDSGEADDFLYYVMPYVEGQSLRDKLAKEGELPIGDAVRMLRDVVDALTEAHANGVVHRDIKPENILLRGRHALVTDFGVAKAVSEATGREQLTTAGVALGTPAYMAPEQASADPHLDHRVDIYAVGAVAYELLTGRPVFMGTTPQMVLSAHMTEAPQPVTKHRETVPAALERVVMRCLEKKPADRWQSAEELLPQLEALTTPSGGITPTDTRPIEAAPAPVQARRRNLVRAVGVAAVALILVGTWIVSGRRGAVSEVDPLSVAVLPFTSVRSDEESDAFATGIHDDIVTQLSKVSALKVQARTSGVEYRGTPKSMRQIGQELGVANLLEGGVQRAGNQVRVNVKLIEAESEQSLWAEAYTREWTVEQLFAIQSDIAHQVASALRATLSPEEEERIQTAPTNSPEAYDAYLRARFHADLRRARDEADKAVWFYEQAVAADPAFAAAHAGLAHARIWLFWEFTQFEQASMAKAALDRAVELAPNAFETQIAQGYYHYYFNRAYDRALEHFLAAEAIRPGDPEVLVAIGYIQRRQGRWEEAVSAFKRSLELDPRSHNTTLSIGESYRFMRRFDEAVRYLDQAISVAPDLQTAYQEKFRALRSVADDSVGARQFLEENSGRLEPAVLQIGYALLAYYRNDLETALRLRREYLPRSYGEIARLYYLLGERDLQRAYADSVRLRGEARLRAVPEEYRTVPYRTVLSPHVDLSLANALLGNQEAAVAGAEAAVELLPVSVDAIRGLDALINLARVYTILGYEEEAIEQLEQLLAIPAFWTASDFRKDPLFSPLRDDPRFRELVGMD